MKKIFAFTVPALLLLSCRTMYSPVMVNTAVLKEKNSLSATLNPANLTAGYALTNHLGVYLSAHSRKNDFKMETPYFRDNWRLQQSLDIGAGYYFLDSTGLHFSIIGMAGLGKVKFGYEDFYLQTTEFYRAESKRLTSQVNLGYSTKNFDVILSGRLIGMEFDYAYQTDNFSAPVYIAGLTNHNNFPANHFIDNHLYFFAEPGITLRFGHKFLKFHTQLIYSRPFGETVQHQSYNFNAGLTLDFPPQLFKKKHPR